jgi:glycine betaine/proline transport system substrate-binding protein
MKNSSRRIFLFFILISILLIATACSGGTDEVIKDKDVVIFADAGWDSLRLHNAIAAFILENGYDYETDVIPGSSANLLEGMVVGDVSVEMEMWQDNMPIYAEYREDGKVIELGTNFDDNDQGLYVPRYLIEGDAERGIEALAPDLKTIDDLKKYSDLFPDLEDPGRAIIINGPPSWEVTTVIAIKAAYYGLEDQYNIVGSGTSAALAASLSAAYEKGEPWVGYYWEPTWISGKYDLVLLEEAPFDEALWNVEANYACAFKPVDVTIIANPEFVQNNPEVAEFLKNYHTSSALTAKALAYMQENEAEIEEAAEWFLKEEEELWKTWVPEDAYNKVMDALK